MKKLITICLVVGVMATSATMVWADPIGYAVQSDGNGHLYSIDLATGAATDLGLVGNTDMQGMEFVGNTLYGITGAFTREFWNITTPPGFKVGDTGPRNGIDAGLAYDPTSGKMYNIQRPSCYLYEINIATGAATYIGVDTTADPDGFAIDSTGVGYALDGLAKDALYTVNLSTGVLTLVGPLGVDLYAEVGLAFDPASGNLYGITDRGQIYTINTSTGAATFVANTLRGFEGLAILVTEIEVAVDIKPQSCPNPVNLKSKGVLAVAVLGTEDVDVTKIDPTTLELSRDDIDDAVPVLRWDYEDVATPFEGELCDCHTLGPDGYLDLTLKFSTPELVETLNLEAVAGGTIPLTLTGKLFEEFDGTPIRGQDCVWVLKEKGPQK